MNAEFFDAVADIEKEKGIPREYMYEKIRQAMLTAFRKDTPDCEDNVEVILDEAKKKIEMVVKKTVVARVIDPYVEISEEAAHRISKRAKIGDVVSVPVETKQFGRIAAQAAKQVIIQGIREAERGMIYEEFNSKEHEILTGVVNKIDPRTGCAIAAVTDPGLAKAFVSALAQADPEQYSNTAAELAAQTRTDTGTAPTGGGRNGKRRKRV